MPKFIQIILIGSCVLVSSIIKSAPITQEQCLKDLEELTKAIETNRKTAIKTLTSQLSSETNRDNRRRLTEMKESAWDQEEQELGMAQTIFRDCINALKLKRKPSIH